MSTAFQRARRPEQIAARRAAILSAAADMLSERRVADISLRELAERVGLAKSNVLRYFDSREAIFLEVLDRTWNAWLDGLALDPRPAPGRRAPPGSRSPPAAPGPASPARRAWPPRSPRR